MIPYLIYLIVAGLEAVIFYKLKDKYSMFSKRNYIIICCIELIILAGIRAYDIGADTETYVGVIDYYKLFSAEKLFTSNVVDSFGFEIGYSIFCRVIAVLQFSDTAFLFIISSMIYVPLFMNINKYSPYPYLSIVIYFGLGLFAYSLGIFRQMIAVSICLCGLKYIEERSMVKYFLIVGIASTFHLSALLMILPYFLKYFKLSYLLYIMIPLQIIFILCGREIMVLLFKILPMYSGYIGGIYDTQGGSYLMLMLLDFVAIAGAIVLKNNEKEHFFIKIIALASYLQCLAYSFTMFGRIIPFLSIHLIFAIPRIIQKINLFNVKHRKYLYAITLILFIALTVFNLYGNEYVCPYKIVSGQSLYK